MVAEALGQPGHHPVTVAGRHMNEPDATRNLLPEPGSPPDSSKKALRSKRNRRAYNKHGLVTLKAAVRRLGSRVLDRRTTVGRQLAAWKADIIRDLGGDP